MTIELWLAGRIRYGEPLQRPRGRDALVLGLANGRELRYHDAADMGKVYLTRDLDQVPAFAGQGPEASDPTQQAVQRSALAEDRHAASAKNNTAQPSPFSNS